MLSFAAPAIVSTLPCAARRVAADTCKIAPCLGYRQSIVICELARGTINYGVLKITDDVLLNISQNEYLLYFHLVTGDGSSKKVDQRCKWREHEIGVKQKSNCVQSCLFWSLPV